MPVFPKAGVELVAVTSDWDSAYRTVLKEAGNLDSLAPTVKVSVTDADLRAAVGLAADLDTSTSLTVNVDESELDTVSATLNDIATIGAIDLAINVAGTAVGFVESLGRFSGLGGILELDSALATIEARTGRMIPGAEQLISDLYTNGWGESRTEIAGVIALAGQLQIAQSELGSATETAFQVAAVTGQDVNEVLNTMDSMVKSGITPSYQAAGDVIVTGFQNGLNKSGDLLDSLGEYGTKLGTMGISAEAALAILNSGMEQGVINTDFISDSVREFGIRLGDIATDENVSAAFEKLDELSDIDLAASLDAYEAGKLSGDDFMQGIFDSIDQANTADPATANTVVEALFGTQAEDLGAEVWGNLSTDADTAFGDIEGRAKTAGDTISSDLNTTVDTFLRGVEQMAVDYLSSDSVDIDGKIETLKTQIQTALSTLSEGGSIGEAIEIGFGIEGVDTTLGNISRVFGQFTLTLLEILAFIQDPTGQTDNDKLTRAALATGAAAQLPFDLQLANSDDVEALLKQAVARGVTDLAPGLTTALDEALAAGNYDQVAEILLGVIKTTEVPRETAQALVNNYTAQVNDAMKAAEPPAPPPPSWTAGFSGVNPLAPKTPIDFKATGGDSGAKGMEWWNNLAPPPETIAAVEDAGTTVTTSMDVVTGAFEEVATSATTNMDTANEALSTLALAGIDLDTQLSNALTENTVTASFDAMSASATANAEITKGAFTDILATVANVDQRLTTFFHGVMAKVGIANEAIANIGVVPPGGGGGNTTNNVYNVNQSNNVQSNAQADAAGYALGAAIRPGG